MSRINTNISALNTQRVLRGTNREFAQTVGRLSSGFRINKASDDAAGLGIANKLRSDVRSLQAASRNAEQANSMLQVMEGASSQISSILDRMKELATQANSASAGADDGTAKEQLESEFDSLADEVDRIVNTTTFNGQTLLAGGFGSAVDTNTATSTALATDTGVHDVSLNGTAAGTYTLSASADGELTITSGSLTETVTGLSDGKQDVTFSEFGITLEMNDDFAIATATASSISGDVVVTGGGSGQFMVSSSGAYSGNDLVSITGVDLQASTLGVDSGSIDISTASGAQSALTAIDGAIDTLNQAVGDIGAAQNRVDYAMRNVETTIENTAAAESVIRDADIAAEATELSRLQILQQAATSVLAQANSAPQGVLSLLR
jgi:flagellin